MTTPSPSTPSSSNFIRQIIEDDLRTGKWKHRPVPVITRFPPEPNGYLHIGHAKSMHLNFGLAKHYKGRCHLRFDDTNPDTEAREYEESIIASLHWLGFDWGAHQYYASSHFPRLYECAQALIRHGVAYVDSQSAEAIRQGRGTLTQPGQNSPWRQRSIEENLDLFDRMKQGEFPDGTHVLRAKIDMHSPNINMRDPTIYRIRHQHHYRSHNDWCIYPMYDFAHSVSDAIEGITHSLCTLEFEDHRPLYDWFLDQLTNIFPTPHPQQIEFARLKMSHTMTSKRKLLALVESGRVSGWDDPRLPTIIGLRRRGFTPNSIALFCERIGIAKADSQILFEVLEDCLREDLNSHAARRIAVLDPVRLILENYPVNHHEVIPVPHHPQKPEWGMRQLHFSRELWIERNDFLIDPPKGFRRLIPGGEVRLRYGYIIKCTRFECDHKGQVHTIYATFDPDTKSGHATSPKKVKGNIHWLSALDAKPAQARLFQHLFMPTSPNNIEAQSHWLEWLTPDSLQVRSILVEPSLISCQPEEKFQFERQGYFCADRHDHRPNGEAVFNLAVNLRNQI